MKYKNQFLIEVGGLEVKSDGRSPPIQCWRHHCMLILYLLVYYDVLNNLAAYKLLFRVRTFEGSREVLSTTIFASVAFLSFILSLRYLLKALLTYTAWMFEPRGKMSLRTKIWLVSGTIFQQIKIKLKSSGVV